MRAATALRWRRLTWKKVQNRIAEGGVDDKVAEVDTRIARCLLLSKVLVADGVVTENERNFLERTMQRLQLNDDERRQVIDLEGWNDAEGALVALSLEKKQELIGELIDAASSDGRLSPLEAGMVQRISDALGIPR